MNHLLNVTKKELRELFTPGAVASVVMVIVIFVVLGQAMSGQSQSVTSPVDIGVALEDGEDMNTVIYTYTDKGTGKEVNITYGAVVYSAYASIYGTNVDPSKIHLMNAKYDPNNTSSSDVNIENELNDKGYKYAISIPKAIKENLKNITTEKKQTAIPVYYVYKSGGIFSSTSTTTSATLISNMSKILSVCVISSTGDIPAEITNIMENPLVSTSAQAHTLINGKVYTDITPYQLYSTLMGQSIMIPIVVMLVITMVGSVVISSMGSEKENKTLETLLTMPVKRTTIVSGKLLAAAVMGLFYGVCYLIGMMFYSNGLTSGLSSVNLANYGLSMTPVGWVTMLAILFLSIFSALGICMILGAFTKNYKMAQTMVMPVSVLSIIPMMVLMFSDFNSLPSIIQGIIFAIPFSHPMMAMNSIMLGNTALLIGGIVYLAILDAVLVFIIVRLYNSDILITGLDKNAILRKLGIGKKNNTKGKIQ